MAAGEEEYGLVLRSGEAGGGNESRGGEVDDEADEGGDWEKMEMVGEKIVEEGEATEDEAEGACGERSGEVGKVGDGGEELAVESVEEGGVAAGKAEEVGKGAGVLEEGVGGGGVQLGAGGFADVWPRTVEDVIWGAGGGFAGVEVGGNVEVAGGEDVTVV